MPTYEYQCESCAHTFQQYQPIREEPLKICPICQGPVKRLISAGGGILFKGSGFYQTDYRSSNYQKKAEAEKKPAQDSTPKETKPKP